MITLNNREYTKTEATKLLSAILNSERMRVALTGEPYAFVMSALLRHPKSDEKIGAGVKRLFIDQDPVYKGRCFNVERIDGSVTDFSFFKCIQTERDPHRNQMIGAMRFAVSDQTRGFKLAAYGSKTYARCAITGLNMQIDDCHVDHEPPLTFDTLAFLFLKEEGLKVAQVKVKSGGTQAFFEDSNLEAKWRAFHRRRAVLRVVLDHANLGQKKTKVPWNTL